MESTTDINTSKGTDKCEDTEKDSNNNDDNYNQDNGDDSDSDSDSEIESVSSTCTWALNYKLPARYVYGKRDLTT